MPPFPISVFRLPLACPATAASQFTANDSKKRIICPYHTTCTTMVKQQQQQHQQQQQKQQPKGISETTVV